VTRRRLALQLAAGIAVAATALWLTYRNLDLQGLRALLADAGWGWLLLVLPPLAMSYVFRIIQWRILLSPVRKVTFSQATPPLVAGFMLNSILPARIGEFARALLLSRRTGVARASSLATVVLARIFDGLTLTAMSLIALAMYWEGFEAGFRTGLLLAGAGYLGVLGFAVALRLWRDRACAAASAPFRMLGLGGAASAVDRILRSFAEGLAVLTGVRELVQVALLSICIWGCLALSVVPAFVSLGMPMDPFHPVLVLVLAAFGMLVPTPAGIGTVHAAITVVMPALSTLSTSQAGALALVFHASQFVPVILAGIPAILHEGIRPGDVTDRA
jgi:hypothetical protein